MIGLAKLRGVNINALRSGSKQSKLGTYRDSHILLVGSILPLFCVLDLTVEYSRHAHTHQFLQTVSDAAIAESARILSQGGSRSDAEASTYRVFQAMIPQDRGYARCSIRSIRVSRLERFAVLETACRLRPRLGARLLGGAKGPILVSTKAVFAEMETEADSGETFPQIRLVK